MQRLVQIKQEGEAIVQQLTASGVPQEAIMSALSGQQPPQPGMGAGRGPDLPPPMTSGADAVREYESVRGAPQGLLGGR